MLLRVFAEARFSHWWEGAGPVCKIYWHPVVRRILKTNERLFIYHI